MAKELIYVAVSMTNSCEYCINFYITATKSKGMVGEHSAGFLSIVSLSGKTNLLIYSIKVPINTELKSENLYHF